MAGSSMTDRELTIVAGKNKKGSAIPVRVP